MRAERDDDLRGLLSAPGWLRDIGVSAWLLVGIALFLVGLVWLPSLTQVIVVPVITAAVVAAVASPVVGWLQAPPRAPRRGAILLLLVLVGVAVGVIVVVIAGITSETDDLKAHLDDARKTIEGWLKDIGVDPGKAATRTRTPAPAPATR